MPRAIRPPAPSPRPVRKSPEKLVIPIDDVLAEVLDEAITAVSGSRAAIELGVIVDRARVARMLILRGAEVLLGGEAEPVTTSPPLRVVEPRASSRAGAPVKASTLLREDGTLQPPPEWVSQEKDPVPSYQHDVHAHYDAAGWDRWLVWISEKEWAYAYWTDRLDMQDGVLPWPSAQVVNLGERGVSHMIPGYHGRD